jgi:guanine deaminase
LGLPVGRFEVGASFDAIVVDVGEGSGSAGLRRWAELDDEARLFEKIVRLAGPGDLAEVWVAGRRRTITAPRPR